MIGQRNNMWQGSIITANGLINWWVFPLVRFISFGIQEKKT